jgi:hypothetical protein
MGTCQPKLSKGAGNQNRVGSAIAECDLDTFNFAIRILRRHLWDDAPGLRWQGDKLDTIMLRLTP